MQMPTLSVARDRMRSGWWCVILSMCVASCVSSAATPALPPSQAVSSSRQFIVYADTPLQASAVCAFAEGVKRSWARELQVSPDASVTPVLILMSHREQPSESGPVGPMIESAMTAGGPVYRIQIYEPPRMTEEGLMLMIVRAFNADLARTGQADARVLQQALDGVPWWMNRGLSDVIAGDAEAMRGWVIKSLDAGQPLTVSDILGSDKLTDMAVDRERHRAHAWLMTQSLLGLTDGPRRFAVCMRAMASGVPWERAVMDAFGAQFRDRVAMEKWWAVQVAYRSTTISARNLTREETIRRLKDILVLIMLRLDDADQEIGRFPVPIEDWWRYHDAGWFKSMLSERMARLTLLRNQGHPLYEPVVAQYVEALNWLVKGNITRFRRAQRAATTTRDQVDQWFDRITHHLDAVEQSGLPAVSDNLFRGFFDALREFEKDGAIRRDPVADHLDRFDH